MFTINWPSGTSAVTIRIYSYWIPTVTPLNRLTSSNTKHWMSYMLWWKAKDSPLQHRYATRMKIVTAGPSGENAKSTRRLCNKRVPKRATANSSTLMLVVVHGQLKATAIQTPSLWGCNAPRPAKILINSSCKKSLVQDEVWPWQPLHKL